MDDMPDLNIIEEKIQFEALDLAYRNVASGLAGGFIAATILFFNLYSVIPRSLIISWYTGIAILTLIRSGFVILFFHYRPTVEKFKLWKSLFIISSALGGISWGIAATLLQPQQGIYYQAIIVIIVAGVSGSAIQVMSAIRPASLIFILTSLLPLIGWLFKQEDLPHTSIAITIIIYSFLLLSVSNRTHRSLAELLKLRFAHAKLIENLSTAKLQLENINKDLEVEVYERKLAIEQLRHITDALPVLIAYIDTNQCYLFTNKAYVDWFCSQQITGKYVKDFLQGTAYHTFTEYFSIALTGKELSYETAWPYKNTEERNVAITLIPHSVDDQLKGFYCLATDITSHKKSQERLNYLATHDTLTNLPNRILFYERLNSAIEHAKRYEKLVALLFVDLDRFKNINDTLGHGFGDELLLTTTKRLQENLRSIDTIARLGGDEFIIILDDAANIEKISETAKKLCAALAKPYYLNNQTNYLTGSIGISLYPKDGTDIPTLLKNADIAMYRAKEKGRNNFQFYSSYLDSTLSRKVAIESGLYSALRNNEFMIYYQPILDLKTGKISGAEALLRWEHPELGSISPSQFISVAEEIGLLVPISEWILHTVCTQNHTWQLAGLPPMRISVNLSIHQFKDPQLSEKIKSLLTETKLDGKYLALELTENLILQSNDSIIKNMQACRDLGVSIYIDDFGTGYSSFSYLTQFPIDVLKIDRAFVEKLPFNAKSIILIKGIFAIAHNLNLITLAEGVEKPAQLTFLQENGCDYAQGYSINPALKAEEFIKFLKNS